MPQQHTDGLGDLRLSPAEGLARPAKAQIRLTFPIHAGKRNQNNTPG